MEKIAYFQLLGKKRKKNHIFKDNITILILYSVYFIFKFMEL